jgi:hypothetical protein
MNRYEMAEYRAWKAMKTRCTNPNRADWKNYGGRGISVCERWATSFENFLADVGPKPSPLHTLDRILNDGSYEPGNCRWATRGEQLKNKRPWGANRGEIWRTRPMTRITRPRRRPRLTLEVEPETRAALVDWAR